MLGKVILLVLVTVVATADKGIVLTDATFEAQTGIRIHHYKEFRDNFAPISSSWFIMYETPWCTECKRISQAWHGLSETNPDIKLATINCIQNRKSCYDVFVSEYPTIILFLKEGKAYKYKFSGTRNQTMFPEFINGGYKNQQPFIFYTPTLLERTVTWVTSLGIIGLAIYALCFATFLYTCFTFLFSERRPRKHKAQIASSTSIGSVASQSSPKKRD